MNSFDKVFNMLKDLPKPVSSIKAFSLPPNKTILKLIYHVEEVLSTFYYLGERGDDDDWEDDVTQALVEDLNQFNPRIPFYFDKQHRTNRGRHCPLPDIGVKVKGGDYFFHLEAKLFVKEYVYGATGGVERFKKEKHGVEYINSVRHRFSYSGILGYMLDNDFQHWHNKVNSWIQTRIRENTDIEWTDADKLELIYQQSKVAKFHSKNKTVTGEIELVHLWVDLK